MIVSQGLPIGEAASLIEFLIKLGPYGVAVIFAVLWLTERKERRDGQAWLRRYLELNRRAMVALRFALFRRGMLTAGEVVEEGEESEV